ncbi:DNA polymerase III subunit epsilon [Pseudomonas phage nickie]|uniref:DNA polymerase III subunit epsilon n=1 Tax=Pseudomonas phage nickie TaxID=2048977 RepID=A0A2H4P776_9CAUD|nr:DNA polymerase exonuclease subunit [Pseudomonas phage nickie]ATW58032.1 DNA polymerase III subunit epsilon [Pseudomonas phage nickie]
MVWKVATIGDIETTGLKQEDGHRIIEVALSVWAFNTVTGDKRKLGKPYIQRINPERPIDPGAEAVHKISLADLRGKPKWDKVAPTVSGILSRTDVFIAHNAAFDAPFLALELIRVKMPMPTFDVYCTMEQGRKATGFGKVPNLGELAYACGYDYDTDAAHSALYDTQLLENCYWYGVENGLFKSPADI